MSKTRSHFAYQLKNHPTHPQLCFPGPTQFLFTQNRGPPVFCLQKLSPGGSAFDFLAPTRPPLCHAQLLAPTTSSTVYSTPIGYPLPENGRPYVSLAKLSPGGSVLDFDPNWPPHRATPNRWPPRPQTWCTPLK